MRVRNRTTSIALLAVAFTVAPDLYAQELPAGFGWFRNVVGHCWVGTLPDGITQHTHCYTSQFGRFIRGTSTLIQTRRVAKKDN